MDWIQILIKAMEAFLLIMTIYFGFKFKDLKKAIETFVKQFKLAYEDEEITGDEWRRLIAAMLDVLVAALPHFTHKKVVALLDGIRWENKNA
jgi:hypothetical protein